MYDTTVGTRRRGKGGGVPAYVTPDLRCERRDLEKVRTTVVLVLVSTVYVL